MTELNNGKVPQGGVLLGSRQRTVVLNRTIDQKLSILAQANGVGESEMLSAIIEQAVTLGFNQALVGKLIYVLANWTSHARF